MGKLRGETLELSQEIFIAEKLARVAGRMSLAYRNQLVISHKPNNEGPVTNADLAIDQYLVDNLRENFPSDRIISEEGDNDDGAISRDQRTWFVDPIDGTASYMMGLDDYVVMVGLAINGEARLGVIYEPCRDRLWSGVFSNDVSARRAIKYENEKITPIVLEQRRKPERINLIGSRMHKSRRQDALIEELNPKNVSYQSSIGLKAMLVLEQQADLYVAWSKSVKFWDSCAPAAIVKAAYGHISFIDGSALKFLGPISHNQPIMIAGFDPEQNFYDMLIKIGRMP